MLENSSRLFLILMLVEKALLSFSYDEHPQIDQHLSLSTSQISITRNQIKKFENMNEISDLGGIHTLDIYPPFKNYTFYKSDCLLIEPLSHFNSIHMIKPSIKCKSI